MGREGILIVKVLPTPSVLLIKIFPPIILNMFFTRYKPNPLPLSLEPSGLWAWRNLWKISNRFSWDIPIPVSLIEISISDPKSLTETYILPSTFVNFTALERRLQPILVEEPTKEDTLRILLGLREKYEQHHNVSITDDLLKSSIELSSRYITDR